MKATGVRKYLSGGVEVDEADYIFEDKATGNPKYVFKNIMEDARPGYAYKVTFASLFPNFGSEGAQPYAIQSFSRRELLRFNDQIASMHVGERTALNTPYLAADNRTIAMIGGTNQSSGYYNYGWANYQNQYVIKGDAMVTNSISIVFSIEHNTAATGGFTTYYIELEEYEISDNENILLILNERAQGTSNRGD
jgi:hypothetical protein|tara:strand:+ start:739 stop:1320 length:582 start_codon:yes stop_codon:yes gene_type:complete